MKSGKIVVSNKLQIFSTFSFFLEKVSKQTRNVNVPHSKHTRIAKISSLFVLRHNLAANFGGKPVCNLGAKKFSHSVPTEFKDYQFLYDFRQNRPKSSHLLKENVFVRISERFCLCLLYLQTASSFQT